MAKHLYHYRRALELGRVGVLFEASNLDYYRQVLFNLLGRGRKKLTRNFTRIFDKSISATEPSAVARRLIFLMHC